MRNYLEIEWVGEDNVLITLASGSTFDASDGTSVPQSDTVFKWIELSQQKQEKHVYKDIIKILREILKQKMFI